MFSSNQQYFTAMCFILYVIFGNRAFASFSAALLSSHTAQTFEILSWSIFNESLNVCRSSHKGKSVLIAEESAMYSASQVESAISVCNFED